MLCDKLIGTPWLDADAREQDKLEKDRFRLEIEAFDAKRELVESSREQLLETVSNCDLRLRLARKLNDQSESILRGDLLSLTEGSAAYTEGGRLKERIKAAQKFSLSLEFVDATLEKLATPATVVDCKGWFSLPHDPMWMEWSGIAKSDFEPHDDHDSRTTRGVLLERDGGSGVLLTLVGAIKGAVVIGRSRFYPRVTAL